MGTPVQDEQELQNILVQLERESTDIVSLHRTADSLRHTAQLYRQGGNLKRAQELLWEAEALMLDAAGQYRFPEAQEYLVGRIDQTKENVLWNSKLRRALACVNPDYQIKLDHAESCEQVIAYFRRGDSLPGDVLHHNFATNTQYDWSEVVQCYREAMNIYRQYNQPGKAKALLTSLLNLAQTCNEFTAGLALRLLLTLQNKDLIRWLEKISPGVRAQLKAVLRQAINQTTLEHELDFWLLAMIRHDEHRSALELLRDLAEDEQEQRAVNVELCGMMELAAELCFLRGNIDTSEMWYRYAAQIAQERLGDTERAGRLLEAASKMPPLRAQRPLTDLDMLVFKEAEEQHRVRFLPSPEQFLAEYASIENKLAKLLTDERLLLDKTAIETQVAKYRGKGLMGSGLFAGTFTDARGNPRGDYPIDASFTEQYVREVVEIVGTLLDAWHKNGDLVAQQVIAALDQRASNYDRTIFEVGVFRHFQSDYIAAIHILIPRFEDFVSLRAEQAKIVTKRFKDGLSGEALLNDLIRPDNIKMRTLLGEALLELAWWYMVKNTGPFNWRNKVAHGWIQPTDCNVELSAMTIYLTLQVAEKAKSRSTM